MDGRRNKRGTISLTSFACSRASTATIYHKIFKIKRYFNLLPTLSVNASQGDTFFIGLVICGWQRTTELSVSLRTWKLSKVWDPYWEGAVWLGSLVVTCARKSPRPSIQDSRTPKDGPISFLFLLITQTPHLDLQPRFYTVLIATASRLKLSRLVPLGNMSEEFPRSR